MKILHRERGTIQHILQRPILLPVSAELEKEFYEGIEMGVEWGNYFSGPIKKHEVDFFRDTGEYEIRLYGEE